MSGSFASRWLDWEPGKSQEATDTTDTTGSVSSVSGYSRRTAPGIDGLSVLGENPDRERGKMLSHPWRGRTVDSPRGPGRLIWTDGYRAAVSTNETFCWLVDLAGVRAQLAPMEESTHER